MKSAIICDLDGTLALMNGRNPYDASNCDKDLPNIPVIETVKGLHKLGYEVIFLSGRMDKYREPTERFILQHCPFLIGEYGWDFRLYMRKSGDNRKDSIIKEELYRDHVDGQFRVLLVLDDRNQVVDLWRDLGLTCFQVAPGDF